MTTVTTTFVLTDKIRNGLADGTYERVGGMIRETQTKRVVHWLREVKLPPNPGIISEIGSVASVLNLGVSVLNLGVSVINLGVTVMGFQMVSDRLNHIEKCLQQNQEALLKSNQQLASKIDLSFYANFRAAIHLADYAFRMNDLENRKACAAQAINRFLEAESHYIDYTKNSLEAGSRATDQYLATLFLAYIVEAQCHLELGEATTAKLCLDKGAKTLKPFIETYIKDRLTSNPAAYLHPALQEKIDLTKLTNIYRWLEPNTNENAVFQSQRLNLTRIAQSPDHWIKALPDAVVEHIQDRSIPKIYEALPKVMEKMEAIIETYRRFEAYQSEVQAIAQLGMSFQEWLQLKPSETQPEGAELMYIMPSEPLELMSVY